MREGAEEEEKARGPHTFVGARGLLCLPAAFFPLLSFLFYSGLGSLWMPGSKCYVC